MNMFESFGYLFGKDKEIKTDGVWLNILSEEEIDEIISKSFQKVQVIYKHSTRCAISYFALKNLESISPLHQTQADFYRIDVIAQRLLSAYISQKFGIRHESPQVLVIKKGEVTWQGSHHQVQADVVETAL